MKVVFLSHLGSDGILSVSTSAIHGHCGESVARSGEQTGKRSESCSITCVNSKFQATKVRGTLRMSFFPPSKRSLNYRPFSPVAGFAHPNAVVEVRAEYLVLKASSLAFSTRGAIPNIPLTAAPTSSDGIPLVHRRFPEPARQRARKRLKRRVEWWVIMSPR